VAAGETLNFAVTAARRGNPLSVTATGLPPSASFDGKNFSWTGAFVDTSDSGNHDVTFAADGESTVVNIATTQYPVTGMDVIGLDGMPVWSLPVPLGGQALLSVQPQFDNPYGVPSLGGQGANAWNQFAWSIDATYLADFFSATNVAVIEGAGGGTTQLHARFTDAVLGEVDGTAFLDVLEVVSVAVSPADLSFSSGFHRAADRDGYARRWRANDEDSVQLVDFGRNDRDSGWRFRSGYRERGRAGSWIGDDHGIYLEWPGGNRHDAGHSGPAATEPGTVRLGSKIRRKPSRLHRHDGKYTVRGNDVGSLRRPILFVELSRCE
jgi:hypothetical protein